MVWFVNEIFNLRDGSAHTTVFPTTIDAETVVVRALA